MLIAARERREQNSVRRRISYDDFREFMEGRGRVRVRGLVRQPGVRGADQGRDQGDDPRAAGRGVPLGGGADDLSQVRTRGDRRGGMGQGVLTTASPASTARCCCEGVSLRAHRRRRRERPCIVYSAATIRDRYRAADRAARAVPHRIHYTLKANSSLGVLHRAARTGRGRRRRIGRRAASRAARRVPPSDIIFGGVGKTEGELAKRSTRRAALNAESEAEVRILDRLGARTRHRRRACRCA